MSAQAKHCKPDRAPVLSRPAVPLARQTPLALVRCAQILICSLAIALAGCSPPETGPEYLDDYLQRLARTLDTPVPVSDKLWACLLYTSDAADE